MTHLSQPGHGILGGESIDAGGSPVSVFQVEDKPALMSEWNQNPPNQWRAEAAPLYAIYGMGLQGWDASLHFAGSYPWMETGWPGQGRGPTSYVDETPLYMGQYPALARLIYGGYIQQGAAAAARRVSVDDVFRGIDCLSQALPNGGYPGQDNIYTPPEVTAIGRLSFKADDSLTSSDSARVDWSTYWDQTNKIITSTTGQLVWNYNDKVVQVKAAKDAGPHRLGRRQGNLRPGRRPDQRQLGHPVLQPAAHPAGRRESLHLLAYPGHCGRSGHRAGHGLRLRR